MSGATASNNNPQDKVKERQAKLEKRCDSCNALLLNHKNVQGAGTLEIKCRKCGHMNQIEVNSLTIK